MCLELRGSTSRFGIYIDASVKYECAKDLHELLQLNELVCVVLYDGKKEFE